MKTWKIRLAILLGILAAACLAVCGYMLVNQDSLQRVRTLQVPLLLIHGTQDEKVPFTMSKELYAAAPKPKKLLLIERAGHANCPEVGGVEYDAAVTTFVQTQLNRSIGQ
jgi:fermentation-respiration switch protein FrsA (DUF1100 family)